MNPTGKRRGLSPSALRYRHDPAYRDRQLKRSNAVRERNKHNPVWMALTNTRKRISETRQVLDRYIELCGRKEKLLWELLKRRDELQRELANQKEHGPAVRLEARSGHDTQRTERLPGNDSV